jgi:1-acyl-sn-glycerol-3-phosphate acyltransferase
MRSDRLRYRLDQDTNPHESFEKLLEHHPAVNPPASPEPPTNARGADEPPTRRERLAGRTSDRSPTKLAWYRFVQAISAAWFAALWGLRATGRENLPKFGGILLVSNHASFLDVFVLGLPLRRPLNFVARSTLFVPGLGWFIRSLGAFPIQREGMGAAGMKETLRRLRDGGIVTLFPEGTRTRDGELGPLKHGIAVLVARAGVPVVPSALSGTFEGWPRWRLLPVPHPVRVHYGAPIWPEEIRGLDPEAVTGMIRERMEKCLEIARHGLARDLNA